MIQCPYCRLAIYAAPELAGQAVACPECGGRFLMPSKQFDPYHTWLGIPPDEQPPHLYRLLGLRMFEPDPRVIENAADRQIMHLRSLCGGASSADAHRLLNEVENARITLLDSAQRTVFDAQLRQALAQTSAKTPYNAGPALPTPTPHPSPQFAAPTAPGASQVATAEAPRSTSPLPSTTVARQLRRSNRPSGAFGALSTVGVVVGGGVGLAIGVLLVYYLTGQDFLGLSNKLRNKAQAARADAPPGVPQPQPGEARKLPQAQRQEHLLSLRPEPQPEPPKLDETKPPENPHVAPSNPTLPAPLPQQAPAQLLSGVPAAWRAPPLISSEPVSIFKLAHEPTSALSLTIHTALADIGPPSALAVRVEKDNHEWTIRHLSDIEADDTGDVVATVRRQSLDVSFAWAQSFADHRVRRELANCLLEITYVNDSRVVQLREPIVMGPMTLDLTQEKQEIECDVVDPPAASTICLKIRELVGFARGAKLKNDVRSITLLKPGAIEFTEVPGAEIEVRLARQPTTGKLVVRSEPVFREGSNKKFDLTLPSLEKMRVGQEKALRESQADLSDAQSGLSRANSALQTLQSNRPRDINQLGNWNRQVVAVRASIDQLSRRVARASKQVAESKARLDAVPNLKAFLDSLHQRALVKYQICAGKAGRELLLVDGERVPAATGAE